MTGANHMDRSLFTDVKEAVLVSRAGGSNQNREHHDRPVARSDGFKVTVLWLRSRQRTASPMARHSA